MNTRESDIWEYYPECWCTKRSNNALSTRDLSASFPRRRMLCELHRGQDFNLSSTCIWYSLHVQVIAKATIKETLFYIEGANIKIMA